MRIPRRGFLAGLGALAAVTPRFSLEAQAAQGWDLSWLDQLKGKHRQVFDLGEFEEAEGEDVMIIPPGSGGRS